MTKTIHSGWGRTATRWGLGLLLAATALSGATAWAESRGMGPEMHGGMHGGMWAASPEQVSRRVDHLLRGMDATDAQRTEIKRIAQAAVTDVKALHEGARGQRAQGLKLLAAPTVDAAAVEAQRQQHLAVHDKVSRRISQALLEVANVLTPAQRVLLAERIQKRAEHMHKYRAEHRGPAASQPAQ
jgi:periplasmic protein CpxP/Spy